MQKDKNKSSEGERSQRNDFFVTFLKSENLKEKESIKTSDKNRNVRSSVILGQKKKGDDACLYVSISAFHVEKTRDGVSYKLAKIL